FDIICVLIDRVDTVADERLAKFVVSSHQRNHRDAQNAQKRVMNGDMLTEEEEERELECDPLIGANPPVPDKVTSIDAYHEACLDPDQPMPQDFLRKYIEYARSKQPRVNNVDTHRLQQLYMELRAQSAQSGGQQVTARQIESVIRIAEA
ncbi:DNA replication licensing factor Mcm2, partial [Kipferlia bialata]